MSSIFKSKTIYLDKNNPNNITQKCFLDDNNDHTNSVQAYLDKRMQDVIQYAQNKAKIILEDARKKADNLIEQAHRKRDDIYDKAHKSGYKAGYSEGEQKGKQLYEQKLNDLEKQRQQMYKEIEKQAVDLAVSIAEKILNHELYINRESLFELIKFELNDINYKNYIILKVSQEDYDFIKDKKNNLTTLLEQPDILKIKVDNDLQQGSFLIETEYGILDKSIKTQIQTIKDVFASLMHQTER